MTTTQQVNARPLDLTVSAGPVDNASPGIPADVAGMLRACRLARGWSIRRCGREVGTDPSMVLRLERGERRPSVATAMRIIDRLELDWIQRDRLLAVSAEGRP